MRHNRHHLAALLVLVAVFSFVMATPGRAETSNGDTSPTIETEYSAKAPTFYGAAAVSLPVGTGGGSVRVSDPRFATVAVDAAGAAVELVSSVDAVNTETPGSATVHYTATDAEGNTAETDVVFTVSSELDAVVVRRTLRLQPGTSTVQAAGIITVDGGIEARLIDQGDAQDVSGKLVSLSEVKADLVAHSTAASAISFADIDASLGRLLGLTGVADSSAALAADDAVDDEDFAASEDEDYSDTDDAESALQADVISLDEDWQFLSTVSDEEDTFVPVIIVSAGDEAEAHGPTIELRYDPDAVALTPATFDSATADEPSSDEKPHTTLNDLLTHAVDPVIPGAADTVVASGSQAVIGSRVMTVFGATDARVSASALAGDPGAATGTITYAVAPGSEELIDVDSISGLLTIKAAGSAEVVATAASTVRYKAASTIITISIAKAPQVIDAPSGTTLALGETVTVDASLSSGDGRLAYTVMGDDDVVSVDPISGVLTAMGVGTTTVAVSAQATDNYLGTAVPLTVMVAKQQQILIVPDSLSVTYGGDLVSINPSRIAGVGAISYALAQTSPTDVVSVNASTGVLTALKAGEATVVVTAAETEEFSAATAEVTVKVKRGTQSITAPLNLEVALNGTTSITATVKGSGAAAAGTLSYSITAGSDKASYESGLVRGLAAGNATLTVRAAQTDQYNAAQATIPVNVTRAVQTVNAVTPVNLTCGGSDGQIALTGRTGDGAISYALASDSPKDVVEVNATTGALHALKSGTATVVVTAAESASYNKATTTVTINVAKGTPTLTFAESSISKHPGDAAFTNAISTKPEGLELSYTSSKPSVASVVSTSGLVTPAATETGSTTITASFAGNDSYQAAQASYTLTLTSKQAQTILVDSDSISLSVGASANVGARLSAGNGTLSYKSSNQAIAEVDSTGKVTAKASGTTTVTVTAAETATYAQATKVVTVNVLSSEQSFNVVTPVTMTYGQTDVKITVSNHVGDGAISYALASDSAQDVVSVDSKSGMLTALNAGKATIAVTAASTASMAALTKNVEVTVLRAEQTLSAPESLTLTCGGATGSAAITAHTGNGAVSYSVAPEGIVSVDSKGEVTPIKAGTATITATAAETDRYALATATTNVTVVRGVQVVTASDLSVSFGDANAKIDAYTNGDGALSYAVTADTDVVEVDAKTGQLSPKKAGSATVTVTAAETDSYTAATKDVTVTVAKTDLTDTAIVICTPTSFTFDASEHTPEVTVRLGSIVDGATLTKDVDYTVAYTNNIHAGIASATITGIGNYTGTATATFAITAGERSANATVVDGAPVAGAKLATSIDELLDATKYPKLFTPAERDLIDAGAPVRVWINVAKTTVDASAYATSNSSLLTAQLGASPTVALITDITLMKSVNGADPTAISEPGGAIPATLTLSSAAVPTDASNRTWRTICTHNGTTIALDTTFDPATKSVSVKLDRFSTFAVAYGAVNAQTTAASSTTTTTNSGTTGSGTSPKTGDMPWLPVAASLAAVGLVVGLAGLAIRRRR